LGLFGLTFRPAVFYKESVRGKYLISQPAVAFKSIHNPSRQSIIRALLPINISLFVNSRNKRTINSGGRRKKKS
jgi:hypothetical protein